MAWEIIYKNLRNFNGPSTDPWGTPDVTGTECECFPSRTTLCLLFSRKLFNHCNEMSSKPHLNNLYSKPLCGTLSNALLKVFMLAMNGYGPQGKTLFWGTDFPKVKLPGEIFHGYIIKRKGENKREENFPKCFKAFV